MKKYLFAGLLLTTANYSFSEDIELYISDSIRDAKTRPQVLIVFDNSGSMSRNETVKASYDPEVIYPAVGGLNSLSDKFVYYTKGSVDGVSLPVPDSPNEARRFLDDINSCQIAKDIIDEYGYYTGHVREYSFKGNSGSWIELPDNNGANIDVIDCEDDVIALENRNAGIINQQGGLDSLPDGYPVDGDGTKQNPIYHDPLGSNVSWSGGLVTLYSDNYLRWYQSSIIANEIKSRLEIAQESVTNLINASPNIDFGLQVFNYSQGGRIVFGITESNLTSRGNILDLVNNNLNAENWTPLCETLYEASLYFSGKSVDYGDYHNNPTPSRDKSIETSAKVYKSPFSSCSDKAYVIIITDGEPTKDSNANSKVQALGSADGYPMSAFDGNYLAALAGWMNNNDVNDNVDGKQVVTTYTIGFGSDAQADAEPLLKEAALLGGGKYFPAQDTASLTAALTNVLANLEPSNDTLTSASVAANNFDRTETLNSVYYAMFQPDRGPRWQGNLKKYKVIGGAQQGSNGKAAIDETSGHFADDVTSYWSSQVDGNKVAEGGVAEMLRAKSNRVVYSDNGVNGAFTLLNEANLSGHEQEFADLVGIDVDDALEYFNWNLGIDVDDEDDDGDIDDIRYDIFGDPLHSQPLVVNYGDKIHIIVGTNAGAIHMFEDSGESVDETWAFMPKEFFPNIKKLKDNFSSDAKVYGIDGKITAYIDDKDGDGVIEAGDKVWVFFGLRRGGSSYYGMDISNPDSPSLLWHINANTSGFSELGQSWSQPKVAFSKLNISSGVAKPVLFFGGGYDTSKDNAGVGSADNIGRAIYMLDAETGALKWSLAPGGGTTTFSGTDSIAANVATLDSDADGLTDRLYAADTGGNVWRVDMPSASPTGSEPWSVFKLASLGGETAVDDRRFFNEPDIVRTFITETLEEQVTDSDGNTTSTIIHQEIPYDAILLGSGDRSSPLNIDTDNMFFMIKDKYIKTQTFSSTPPASTPPTTLVIGDLFDITANPLESVSDAARPDLERQLSDKSGWYFSLEQPGEKSTSKSITINNTVYFTTFTPPDLDKIDEEGCEIPNGQGWLYAVDLAQGVSKHSWSEVDKIRDGDARAIKINEQILDTPTLFFIPNSDGDDDTIDPVDGGIFVGGQMFSLGFAMSTKRTYLYILEDRQ